MGKGGAERAITSIQTAANTLRDLTEAIGQDHITRVEMPLHEGALLTRFSVPTLKRMGGQLLLETQGNKLIVQYRTGQEQRRAAAGYLTGLLESIAREQGERHFKANPPADSLARVLAEVPGWQGARESLEKTKGQITDEEVRLLHLGAYTLYVSIGDNESAERVLRVLSAATR